MDIRIFRIPHILLALPLAAALFSACPVPSEAAGTIRGVGTMGYGSSSPGAPPRSSFGNSPNDYKRGYEGNSPSPGDPWGREADFKARNYEQRYSPPPQYAAPPASPAPSPAPAPVYPSSPKPPLPGDRDFETAPPAAGAKPGQ